MGEKTQDYFWYWSHLRPLIDLTFSHTAYPLAVRPQKIEELRGLPLSYTNQMHCPIRTISLGICHFPTWDKQPCAVFTFSVVNLTCNTHWYWGMCVEYHSNVGTTSYTLEQALVELVTTQPTEQASTMKNTSALWINCRNMWNMLLRFGTGPGWTNYHAMKCQFALSSSQHS
jgi:hypothetical protein